MTKKKKRDYYNNAIEKLRNLERTLKKEQKEKKESCVKIEKDLREQFQIQNDKLLNKQRMNLEDDFRKNIEIFEKSLKIENEKSKMEISEHNKKEQESKNEELDNSLNIKKQIKEDLHKRNRRTRERNFN